MSFDSKFMLIRYVVMVKRIEFKSKILIYYKFKKCLCKVLVFVLLSEYIQSQNPVFKNSWVENSKVNPIWNKILFELVIWFRLNRTLNFTWITYTLTTRPHLQHIQIGWLVHIPTATFYGTSIVLFVLQFSCFFVP